MSTTQTAADRRAMQVTDEVAIQIVRMNKWYGTFHVLRDINLTVQRGERIVICGPSGSGKSTLIRCINRLEEHQAGQIIVDGTELTNDLKNIDKVRSEVGMVFQHFNLFPHLTILENLTLAPIWVRKIPKREAEETAMYFLREGEDPRAGARNIPASFRAASSSAWPSRARSCMKPRIMLFDEPTTALDPEMIKEVLDTMIAACRRGHDDALRDPRDGLCPGGGEPGDLHGPGPDRGTERTARSSSATRSPSAPSCSSARSSATEPCTARRGFRTPGPPWDICEQKI